MYRNVVITGIGLMTPLGKTPAEVLHRIESGESTEIQPAFDTSNLLCKLHSPIAEFHAEEYIEDTKSLRLMNRDAQLAVAAARLAIANAKLEVGKDYPSESISLYGSTGLTGMPAEEAANIVKHSADSKGNMDLRRFGHITLKRVRPVLSFKILANMPICFVSIFANIRGQNAVYTPWEGHGAQAIAMGIRAIQESRTTCALVGGCNVSTHEFAFVSLQQLGAFRSWSDHGIGPVPGEGAGFLVLEEEKSATARGARVYARVTSHALGTVSPSTDVEETFSDIISRTEPRTVSNVVLAGDGDVQIAEAETKALARQSLESTIQIRPKRHLGNLYAAAAAVQVGLAAVLTQRGKQKQQVLANCLGYGSQQGVFLLEGI
jgi:3-oxoacyl-[acyl-carrier-protein] synthase II